MYQTYIGQRNRLYSHLDFSLEFARCSKFQSFLSDSVGMESHSLSIESTWSQHLRGCSQWAVRLYTKWGMQNNGNLEYIVKFYKLTYTNIIYTSHWLKWRRVLFCVDLVSEKSHTCWFSWWEVSLCVDLVCRKQNKPLARKNCELNHLQRL